LYLAFAELASAGTAIAASGGKSWRTRHTKVVEAARLLQFFIQKRVVTIVAIINNAIYNRVRIPIVSSISVHQPFEFFNL